MVNKYVQSERNFASAIGWTDLGEVGKDGALRGIPPVRSGAVPANSKIDVPRWSRDWSACAPLIAEYFLTIDYPTDYKSVIVRQVTVTSGVRLAYADHESRDAALRYGIVLQATLQVEATKRVERLTELRKTMSIAEAASIAMQESLAGKGVGLFTPDGLHA